MRGVWWRLVRRSLAAALVSAGMLVPVAGFAQNLAQNGADDLAPPPDLDASGVPVPQDNTDISGRVPPPVTAIPMVAHMCGDLAAQVRDKGEALLPVDDGYSERFVREQRFCGKGQIILPVWARTADDPHCFIGYSCRDQPN